MDRQPREHSDDTPVERMPISPSGDVVRRCGLTVTNHESLDEERSGPRCFLRAWPADERMPRHTHPNGMLVMVLSGGLRICEGDRAVGQVVELGAGDRIIRIAEGGGFDHFPHLMRPLGPTLSFHLYSDSPRRGKFVSED